MARRKETPGTEETAQPSFEDALSSLEEIIEEMEHEHLPLEELVAHYEKGSALLARCESLLQSARGRIELITLRNPAEIALDAGEKAADAPGFPSPTADPDEEDDIRLF